MASHDEQYGRLSSLAQDILDRHVTLDKGKFLLFLVRFCKFLFSDMCFLIVSFKQCISNFPKPCLSHKQFCYFPVLLELKLIYQYYLSDKTPQHISEEAMELDQNLTLIQEMHDPLTKKNTCTCLKEYKTLGVFLKKIFDQGA